MNQDLIERIRVDLYKTYHPPRLALLLRDCLAALERVEAPKPPLCVWKQDDEGVYATGCGHLFVFTEGNCAENDAKFCRYCGGSIAEEFEIED